MDKIAKKECEKTEKTIKNQSKTVQNDQKMNEEQVISNSSFASQSSLECTKVTQNK